MFFNVLLFSEIPQFDFTSKFHNSSEEFDVEFVSHRTDSFARITCEMTNFIPGVINNQTLAIKFHIFHLFLHRVSL